MNSNTPTFQFPEVRVVEAAAGSGKTYALARRYVQLILADHSPLAINSIRNVLALTFTNKAAFEMKGRILEFLKRMAFKDISEVDVKNILGPLGISLDTASAKAFCVMDTIIRNYNFFQVQTIDKFINSLLCGCALKIGLTASFKIMTNSREYLEQSLDELIDDSLSPQGNREVLESFLHQYLYIENRSGWFPKEDIMSVISALFSQSNAYGKDLQESDIKTESFIKKKKIILGMMHKLADLLPEKTDARFKKSLDSFLLKNIKGFDVDSLSSYFIRENIPVRKGVKISQDAHELWDKIREDLREVCQEEAYSLFNAYIKIFNEVKDYFLSLSSRDDVLFLEELNKKASMLFDNDYVTVEELYYRLATRFRHYLVDEFQDTSRLQWHNLEKMAEESLSSGGSLFYVGDKKQAIYSFRGGDAKLFDDVKSRFQMFNVQKEFLSNNWRSQRQIVEFNNEIFSSLNLKSFIAKKEEYEKAHKKKNPVIFNAEDLLEIKGVFSDAKQSFLSKNNNGYVSMEYIDIDRKDERDEVVREKLISLIENLKKRFSYRDIAILSRGNYETEKMTNWLLDCRIPVESERTSSIVENPIIGELISFLKFLNSPVDNLAFTQFILGQIFPQATGVREEELQNFVFSLRDRFRRESDFYIYLEFREKYPEVWENFIKEFFKNVGLYPIYELVVSIYNKFNLIENFSSHQGFLMHFLEIIKKQEEDQTDIAAFLDYFENLKGEDLYVRVADSDAIKLLTIHKSKGLEFPVVILPYLGIDIQVGSGNSSYQQSYILRNEESRLSLLKLKGTYLSYSDELYQIYREEYSKAFISELNNVYVALTRPQLELYGFIPKKIGSSFNFLKYLIPEEKYQCGRQICYETKPGEKDSILTLPAFQCQNWIDFLSEEFKENDVLKNRKQREKGELYHLMLSSIGNLDQEKKSQSLRAIREQMNINFPEVDCELYLSKIEELVEKKDLRQFFYAGQACIFREKEVVNFYGDARRIDRLIVDERNVLIVDYKSTMVSEEKDQNQMREYLNIIKDIYPKREVRGFLIYLEDGSLKEVVENQPR